jgi:DNA-binding transcriptional ArsR family regulator
MIPDFEPMNIANIELKLRANTACENINRLSILYLLKKSRENQMKAEDISSILGVSHRTALYHLTILKDYDLVEVRKFTRRGFRLFRSIWGLKRDPSMDLVFDIITEKYGAEELREMIKKNIYERESNSRKKSKAYLFI